MQKDKKLWSKKTQRVYMRIIQRKKKTKRKRQTNMSEKAMLSLREMKIIAQTDWVVIKEKKRVVLFLTLQIEEVSSELRDITKTYKSLDKVSGTAPSE